MRNASAGFPIRPIRPTWLVVWRQRANYLSSHFNGLLALGLLIDAFLVAYPFGFRIFSGEHLSWLSQTSWRDAIEAIGLSDLPRVAMALALALMAIGLLAKARVAWTLSVLLVLSTACIAAYRAGGIGDAMVIYNGIVLFALLRFWSRFDRSSLAAGTLFAIASIVSLLWYANLGVLYLGEEFQPPVTDLANAAYFTMVTMSTVGFGDIVPLTHTARWFVISVVVIGITVFATSLGAVVGPLVGGKLRAVIQQKARRSMRKNHIILCGATPLALGLHHNLTAKGEKVTVVVKPGVPHQFPENADVLIGDASSSETLVEAGVMDALYVLALREDDPDNAFIVLAVKALPDCHAKTVAVVNASQNLEKIRHVNPDMVFSPQILGAELLSRALLGESFDSSIFFELSFAKPASETATASAPDTR